jgi:hypothetical protein
MKESPFAPAGEMFGGLLFPAGCHKERALAYDPSAERREDAFQNFRSNIQIFDAKLCSRRAKRKKFCAAEQALTRNIFER